MNRITQKARKRQGIMKLAIRKGTSFANRMYKVSVPDPADPNRQRNSVYL